MYWELRKNGFSDKEIKKFSKNELIFFHEKIKKDKKEKIKEVFSFIEVLKPWLSPELFNIMINDKKQKKQQNVIQNKKIDEVLKQANKLNSKNVIFTNDKNAEEFVFEEDKQEQKEEKVMIWEN